LIAAASLYPDSAQAAAGVEDGGLSTSPVTFAGDVAPILSAHCLACHQPDGVAPFSLTTYEDAAARAEEIARATGSRHMPPWKPEAGGETFAGARRLSDAQIAAIRAWADAGAPRGDVPAVLVPPGQDG